MQTDTQTKTKRVGKASSYRRFIRINGRLFSQRFLRKIDADRWYVEKRREKELIESGVDLPIQSESLKKYSEIWMAKRKAQGRPESSLKADERRLRLHVTPAMGDRCLNQITQRDWIKLLDDLIVEKELNSATRNRVHSLVSKMYGDALKEGVVSSNPLRLIEKLSESQNKWDYWHTKDECGQYLSAAKEEEPSFFIFAMLALNTGARVGEILALTHEDVDLESRRIHIWQTYEPETREVQERTKGRSDRWLGISDALLNALQEHKRTSPYHKKSDLLVYRDGGHFMEEWMIRCRHRRTCRRGGIKSIRVHDLRHTYASHFVMSGGSLADLQSLLGHSSSEMTRKYAHLTPGHLESKSKVISFVANLESPGA